MQSISLTLIFEKTWLYILNTYVLEEQILCIFSPDYTCFGLQEFSLPSFQN